MATKATGSTIRHRLLTAAGAAVLLGTICATGALAVVASVPSSTNFRVYGDALNEMAGAAASANFLVRDCLGPVPDVVGSASSTSYKVQTGCIGALPLWLPADDEDGDGVDNGDENGAPNNGDGNGDGIADSLQGNIASFRSAAGSTYLTLIVPTDGPCGQLLGVQAVNPSTLGDGDADWFYPFGMLRFQIDNCAGPVPVLVYYHKTNVLLTTYRKYGHMAPDFVSPRDFYDLPGVTFGSATVGAQTVTTASFSLTDNQLGDDSPIVNHIEDPSGPARANLNAVPALSPVGLLLSALALAGVALLAGRRRQRTAR